MLVTCLEKENIKYYIYVKKEFNTYSYYGYVEENNVRKKLSDSDVEFFKDYILNFENINLNDGYKISMTTDKELIAELKNSDNIFNQLLSKKYSGLSLVVFQLILTLSITLGYLGVLNNFQILNDKLSDLEDSIYQGENYILKDVYVGELDSNKIKDIINNSPNLNQDEKDYLINETFFEYIDDYISDPVVYGRLQNLDIVDFTDEEKNDESNDNISGFYNEKQPNILHVRDYEENNTLETNHTNSHEHIHQYQGDYRYSYLVEATCALLNAEFYTPFNQTYIEEQKRLKVLMEIIGTEPILKYVEGSFKEIENILNDNLTDRQVEEFKNCFETRYDDEYIDNIHFKIDELLGVLYYNIYGEKIENDEIINAIYNDMIESRHYFNITNEKDTIFEYVKGTDILEKRYFNIDNNVLENTICVPMIGNPYYGIFNPLESRRLTEDEYKMLSLLNPNIDEYITCEYSSDYQYVVKPDGMATISITSYDDGKFTSKNIINLSIDEAVEQGLLKVERYYNPTVKSFVRLHDSNNIYNNVLLKNDYYFAGYSDEYLLPVAKIKEVPTIRDKFDKSIEDGKIKVK